MFSHDTESKYVRCEVTRLLRRVGRYLVWHSSPSRWYHCVRHSARTASTPARLSDYLPGEYMFLHLNLVKVKKFHSFFAVVREKGNLYRSITLAFPAGHFFF